MPTTVQALPSHRKTPSAGVAQLAAQYDPARKTFGPAGAVPSSKPNTAPVAWPPAGETTVQLFPSQRSTAAPESTYRPARLPPATAPIDKTPSGKLRTSVHAEPLHW